MSHRAGRAERVTIAQQTLATINTGVHEHMCEDSGVSSVDLTEQIYACRNGTTFVASNCALSAQPAVTHETTFEVLRVGTLSAARRLAANGRRPCALNFASAKHPGGGFLNGAEAQEENLARNSALYASLSSEAASPFYDTRSLGRDGLYSHRMIYSPAVPVLRDDDGLPIQPWLCSFVTAAAPNAGVARERGTSDAAIDAVLRARAERVLAVAAHCGHDTLVLGAWGCGVFRNSPERVAAVWHTLLRTRFARCFAHVCFAIRGGGERTVAPFEALFGCAPHAEAITDASLDEPEVACMCGAVAELARQPASEQIDVGDKQPTGRRQRRRKARVLQHRGWDMGMASA